jgi:hypothetical protein
MGRRDNDEAWSLLDEPVRAALDQWLQGKPWDLSFRNWFNDGRSGSPVAVVARSGDGVDDQVVLKFFIDGAHISGSCLIPGASFEAGRFKIGWMMRASLPIPH